MSKDLDTRTEDLAAPGGERGQELSLEASFEKLEEILREMDSGELSLEEAFDRYAEGMQLLRRCSASIDTIEKKVQVLTDEGTLEDFS